MKLFSNSLKIMTLATVALVATATWVSAEEASQAPRDPKDYRCALECIEAALKAPTLESIDTLSGFSQYQKNWIKKRFKFHFPNGKSTQAPAPAAE